MAAESSTKRATKRKSEMIERDTEEASPLKLTKGQVQSRATVQYKFKMLLPNGTTVDLTLMNPKRKMTFGYFIDLVKDEYYGGVWRLLESVKKKRRIDWSDRNLYLEDVNMNVIRDEIDLEMFEPHKWHILKLYVSVLYFWLWFGFSVYALFGYVMCLFVIVFLD